jgi:hypothetical protein
MFSKIKIYRHSWSKIHLFHMFKPYNRPRSIQTNLLHIFLTSNQTCTNFWTCSRFEFISEIEERNQCPLDRFPGHGPWPQDQWPAGAAPCLAHGHTSPMNMAAHGGWDTQSWPTLAWARVVHVAAVARWPRGPDTGGTSKDDGTMGPYRWRREMKASAARAPGLDGGGGWLRQPELRRPARGWKRVWNGDRLFLRQQPVATRWPTGGDGRRAMAGIEKHGSDNGRSPVRKQQWCSVASWQLGQRRAVGKRGRDERQPAQAKTAARWGAAYRRGGEARLDKPSCWPGFLYPDTFTIGGHHPGWPIGARPVVG